jgi:hypothetical protein
MFLNVVVVERDPFEGTEPAMVGFAVFARPETLFEMLDFGNTFLERLRRFPLTGAPLGSSSSKRTIIRSLSSARSSFLTERAGVGG